MNSSELTEYSDVCTTELTDSDYPPVYGEPVDGRARHYSSTDETKLEAITRELQPSEALVDSKQVYSLLLKAGYEVSLDKITSLNIFPSPMDAFQYALYSFGITDIYIVLMVNIRRRSIYGYHVLDLTQNYSLVDDLINRMKNKAFL